MATNITFLIGLACFVWGVFLGMVVSDKINQRRLDKQIKDIIWEK